MASCPEEIRDEFIEQVSSRHWDNVLPMLFDMASAQIEPSWVVNKSDDYLAKVGFGSNQITPVAARFYGIGIRVENGKVQLSHFIPGEFANFVTIMRRFYPSKLESMNLLNFLALESELDKLAVDDVVDENGKSVVTKHNVSIRNIKIEKVPLPMLEASGIQRFADEEYNAIKAIRMSVNNDQKVKNDFLTKLFSPKSDSVA